jgi:hypothetical protein
LLTKHPPEAIDGDAVVYAVATNPEIRSEELIHFIMGVFWKAAVHSWSPYCAEPLIDLGSYADRIRKFLRYEADFPDHLALMIGVLPPPAQLISFYNPYQGSKKEWHNFLFYVSGIEFSLAAGKAVHADVRRMCFSHNPARPIVVADFSADIATVLSSVLGKRAPSEGRGELTGAAGPSLGQPTGQTRFAIPIQIASRRWKEFGTSKTDLGQNQIRQGAARSAWNAQNEAHLEA